MDLTDMTDSLQIIRNLPALELTKEELIVLYGWLKNEFITYDNTELYKVITKISVAARYYEKLDSESSG